MSASDSENASVKERGPLDSIRILELGSLLAGPFAGHLMADLGAEVIKIEPPGASDLMRQWGPHLYQGRGLFWPIIARNKKCITLNLRVEEGREILRRLVRESDVLIENFRPGTMEKWELGWAELAAENPRLIMTRVSGFGQTGPYKERAGFGSVGEAIGGIRYVTGYPDRPPVRAGISLGDSLAAMFATIGTLAALESRHHSGRGQVVDCAIYEAVFALMESVLTEYGKFGAIRERTGLTLPRVTPSNVFPTKDNRLLIIAANQDNVFRRLVQVMERPEMADDPRYSTHVARGERTAEVDGIIAEWSRNHNSDELWAMLNEAGVPAGPIYSAADIAEDEHYRARGMIRTVEDPVMGELKVPGIVPRFSETPGAIKWSGPGEPGLHNREVFGNILGMSDADIERLTQAGVI
ncbi:MAG: CaiB/BaiF CoA transferase family protein [Candidatus Binataceae bacterium]